MTHRYKAIFSALIAIIAYWVIYYCLPIDDRTLINLLGIIGFLLSVVGILIAYFQIMSVLESAAKTQKEVGDAQARFEEKIREMQGKLEENLTVHSNLHMISDLSSKGAMINEIQGYLKVENINMSAIRMKDLKVVLISLKSQPRYSTIVKKGDFITAFDNFNINLDNLQKQHFRPGKIDLVKINKDLEDLSGIFLSVEHNLKKLQ